MLNPGSAYGGDASIHHFDGDGKTRITTGTSYGGDAKIEHYDRDGKLRITTGTAPEGLAAIVLDSSKGDNVWIEQSK